MERNEGSDHNERFIAERDTIRERYLEREEQIENLEGQEQWVLEMIKSHGGCWQMNRNGSVLGAIEDLEDKGLIRHDFVKGGYVITS
jgi:hypothetical protein